MTSNEPNNVLVISSEGPVHEVKKTSTLYRALANSLPARAIESTVQTVKSTAKREKYLSPWGDSTSKVIYHSYHDMG